jgi:hypothetical protein
MVSIERRVELAAARWLVDAIGAPGYQQLALGGVAALRVGPLGGPVRGGVLGDRGLIGTLTRAVTLFGVPLVCLTTTGGLALLVVGLVTVR